MLKDISLRIWVIGGVLATIICSVTIGTWVLLAEQQRSLLRTATSEHSRLTRVLALGVQKALWDLSPESAAPLAKSVMDDSRIVKVTVLDNKDQIFLEESQESRRLGQVIKQEEPIKSDEQVLGKVIVEFSMAQASAEIRSRMIDFIGLAAAEILGCVLVLTFLLNHRVLSRIDRLKAEAKEIADKNLARPFVWKEGDEIGSLGQSLERTRQSLAHLFLELEDKNKTLSHMNTHLENLVDERTSTIKMILNHVKTGFFLIDQSFQVLDGYTRSCEGLLDRTQITGLKLSQILNLEGEEEKHFRLALSQVFEDIMPEVVTLGQIPRNFTISGRTISLEGSTIRGADGQINKILFTIVDITLLRSIELENQVNRSIVNIMQNMSSFRDFIQDSRDRLKNCYSAIETGNLINLRRDLHTLKGNSAAFGIKQIAELIHTTENESYIAPEFVNAIEENLKSFLTTHYSLLKVKFDGEIRRSLAIDEQSLDRFEKDLNGLTSAEHKLALVNQWLQEIRKDTVENMLGPVASYVQKLAHERGIDLNFAVEGSDVTMDRGEATEIFQNLVHLLRNAVDHGLEPTFDRGGKAERASLCLSFSKESDAYVITVSDDGRGIDPKKVAERALLMNLISEEQAKAMSQAEALDLIFQDGLSTAESISDVSGRGMGMKAVKDAIQKVGGTILMNSTVGVGTSFCLRIPIRSKTSEERRAA